jgi:hypothetical protein
MGQQLLAFRAKFGRDAGPDDPIFFDPDADEPAPLPPVKAEAVMTAAMEDVGIGPALIYAWQHTGMLVTEANRGLFEPEDIAEWDEAVRRFDALGEDSDLEGDAWDDDWLPDDDLDLPVAGHDARLLFASPNFDDAESIAAFLLTTIDGAGVVVSQLLWQGSSDLGWPAAAVGVAYVSDPVGWYTSPYVVGYVDALIDGAYIDHIDERDDPDVPGYQTAVKWFLPGEAGFDQDPTTWSREP